MAPYPEYSCISLSDLTEMHCKMTCSKLLQINARMNKAKGKKKPNRKAPEHCFSSNTSQHAYLKTLLYWLFFNFTACGKNSYSLYLFL